MITVEESPENSGVFTFFGVNAEDVSIDDVCVCVVMNQALFQVKGAPRIVGIDQNGNAMRK